MDFDTLQNMMYYLQQAQPYNPSIYQPIPCPHSRRLSRLHFQTTLQFRYPPRDSNTPVFAFFYKAINGRNCNLSVGIFEIFCDGRSAFNCSVAGGQISISILYKNVCLIIGLVRKGSLFCKTCNYCELVLVCRGINMYSYLPICPIKLGIIDTAVELGLSVNNLKCIAETRFNGTSRVYSVMIISLSLVSLLFMWIY